MGTTQPPDPGESLEDLLQKAEPPVRYDVERGIARHQRLLASGAGLPEWANEIPARNGTSLLRKWAPWLGAGFMVGALVFWRVEDARVPEAALVSSKPGHVEDASLQSAAHSSSQRTHGKSRDTLTGHATSPSLPAGSGALTVTPAPTGRLELVPTVEELAPRSDTLGGPTATLGGPTAPLPSTAARVVPEQVSPVEQSEPARPAGSIPTRTASKPSAPPSSGNASSPSSARADDQAPMDREEVMQLAQAEQLLLTDPNAAIALVRKGNLQFKRGYLKHERRYIEVMALFAAGHRKEGQSRAQFFLRDYPTSPYREKILEAAEAHAAP